MATTTRLALRITPADKTRIAGAAALRGMPVAAFVRDAALREAERVLVETLDVRLSRIDLDQFLAAMKKPFKPNAKMEKAMNRGLVRR